MKKRKGRRMNKADQLTLYNAYKQYKIICKKKKICKKQMAAVYKEIEYRIDILLLLLNSPSPSQKDKSKAVLSGKKIYQQYCLFIEEKVLNEKPCLEDKIDQLLFQMTIVEAEQIAMLCKEEESWKRIDLKAIFQDVKVIKILINMPIKTWLKEVLKDTEFTCLSKTDQKIFITEYGRKYHRANCSFCKGRSLYPVTFTQAANGGYSPCRCIEESKEDKMQGLIITLEDHTMTAFIDESFRDNLWKKWDNSLLEKQASYSYIICKGALVSEQEISELNEVSRNVCLASEGRGVSLAATEAISAVLMKMAFQLEFRGEVIIYTDNMCAKDKWYTSESMLYLASLFEKVKVCCIPRKENKIADGIGRELAVIQIPVKLLEEVLRKCQEYDAVCEIMDFIKKRL